MELVLVVVLVVVIMVVMLSTHPYAAHAVLELKRFPLQVKIAYAVPRDTCISLDIHHCFVPVARQTIDVCQIIDFIKYALNITTFPKVQICMNDKCSYNKH